MAKKQRTQILTPHAALIVWNFRERLTSWSGKTDQGDSTSEEGVNAIDEVIISTLSLRGISTQKQKGQPVGNFTVQLAPTKNWVAALTPGSWCALLMSQKPITEADKKQANSEKLKMFGKIISVRANTSVDQGSGARITGYTIIGEDWGHIFNGALYIDEKAVEDAEQSKWFASTFLLSEHIDTMQQSGLPSTSSLVRSLIMLWGNAKDKIVSDEKIKNSSGPNFVLPLQVAQYLSVNPNSIAPLDQLATTSDKSGDLSVKISDIINDPEHRQFGVLTGDNIYSDNFIESIGIIRPTEMTGVRTLWQIFMQACNPILNEVVNDLDFDNGTPRLRLWKRIKPFVVDKGNDPKNLQDDKYLSNCASLFTNLKKTIIPLDQVLHIDVGTNWRDKYNFIEIRIASGYRNEVSSTSIKTDAQLYDNVSMQREGFRPMIVTTNNFLPINADNVNNPWEVTKWKYLLRAWFFDTHRMLNGSITVVGQNEHIPVGSNIMIDAKILGPTPNWNSAQQNGTATNFLAHVEAVGHSFTVNEEGIRTYVTTINFVRGILVDSKGQVVRKQPDSNTQVDNARLGSMSTDIPTEQDYNTVNVFGQSDESDPDPTKFKRGR